MNVPRHFYSPTPTQRAELKATALLHRQRREKRKREAKLEAEAFKDFARVFPERMARELAAVQVRGVLE